VTGFLRGELNEVGNFEVIRKYHAHAWVEVFNEQRSWVAFDPTPAAPVSEARTFGIFLEGIDSFRLLWDMYVVAFDYERQRGVLGGVVRGLHILASSGGKVVAVFKKEARPLIGLAAALVLVFLLGRTRLVRKWLAALRLPWPFRRAGLGTRPESAVRFYEDLLRRLEHLGFSKPPGMTPAEYAYSLEDRLPGLSELTYLYYRARYGSLELDLAHRARVERLTAAVRVAALSMGDLSGRATAGREKA
jgi:hypothetical protein